jgi:preprotein translocase subunit SecE
MKRLINYVKDTRGELKHVSWPSRKQAAAFTAIVLVISLAVSFFLGFFDFTFSELLDRFVF